MKNYPFQPMFGDEDPNIAEMVKSLKEMKTRGRVSKKRTKPILPQPSPTPIIQIPKDSRSLAGLGQFSGFLQNKKILIAALILLFLVVALLVYKQQEQKKKLLSLARQLKKLKHKR